LVAQQPQGELAGYAQGTILSWNPDTFENVISVRGGTLTNVQVGSGVEAMTYRPGDTVILARWRPGGGMGTWWIDRRIIRPGTGAAEQTVDWMRSGLVKALMDDLVQELLTSQAGRDLAAFVLSSRIKSATAAPSVLTSSSTYVALSGGPEVTDVPVSDSGKMLVMVGCEGVVSSAIGQPDQAAAMSFAISGATTRAASDDEAYIVAYADIDELSFFHGRSMAAAEITGLNPGLHTVSARYRKVFGGGDVDFSLRTLIAIGL